MIGVRGTGLRPRHAAAWRFAPALSAALLATGLVLFVMFPAASGSGGKLRVGIEGSTTIRAWTAVRISTSVPADQTAAVTLRIDGHEIGSDTTEPYAVTVDGGALQPGRHSATVELVMRDGRRLRSTQETVRVRAGGTREVRATPKRGFARALLALARGHVTVRLAPGRYPVSALRLGNGARLVGAGSRTVLVAPAGPYWGVVIVDGDDTLLQGIRIDGGGPGGGEGHGIVVQSGVERFVARRITIQRARAVGVYAWGRLADISVQDSDISSIGSAQAGVVVGLEAASDVSVIRCRIARFRSWGVTFAQVPHENRSTGLRSLALDNVVVDIDRPGDTQGTTEGGIWSGGAGAAIIGNVVRRTGWDGIETVGSSHGVSIVDNRVSDTPVGIYLEHATTGSLIARKVIRRVRTGINVEWEYGGVGSGENVFLANHVHQASFVGLFIDVGADGNRVVANVLRAAVAGIVLQGSSGNHVEANVVCGARATVRQQNGRWDDERLATPRENILKKNRSGFCK